MHVLEGALTELLDGEVSLSVATAFGTVTSSVQKLIDGEATLGAASAMGVSTSSLQGLRDKLGKSGAIGLVVGVSIGKRLASK